MTRATNPQTLEAIEAAMVEAIYDARRRARLQLLGRAAAPRPSQRSLSMLRRIKRDQSGLRVVG